MTKNKLERFAEFATFSNCIHLPYTVAQSGSFHLRGKWNESYFKNANPIILELGCGKGEYTTTLARRFPGLNFIGIDIKGNRQWVGAKAAQEEKLNNAAFLRMRIEMITSAFGPGEVSGIWITFPDPHPSKKGEKKRLTSPGFLERYKQVLRPGAALRLKTDNTLLYAYTLDVIKKNNHHLRCTTEDLYGNGSALVAESDEVKGIQTYYEKKFLLQGKKICYLEFCI